MIRYLLIVALACVSIIAGGMFIGRAIDHELAQHVILTRNGVMLDCERVTDVAGRTFYDSCVRVP